MTTDNTMKKNTNTIKSCEVEIANMVRNYRYLSQGNSDFIKNLGLLIKKMYEDNVLSEKGKAAYENRKDKRNSNYEGLAIDFSEYIRKESRKA